MTVCFYSPYMPKHFGGGEKHILDMATVLSQHAEVKIAIAQSAIPHDQTLQHIKEAYEKFLGRSLDSIQFIEAPLGTSQSAVSKLLWTGQFDHLLYVTDGSLFFSLARHNHLHFQVPFRFSNSLFNRLKLLCWNHANANSQFTKQWIESHWPGLHPVVVNPMVNCAEFHPDNEKRNWIVGVGRFFQQLHAKRQDVLIELFAQLPKSVRENWRLKLIGSVEDEAYVRDLQKNAQGLPIDFLVNADRNQLREVVESSTFFWHAAGYEVDETTHPERVEHFGITTLEAMAAGTIPVVHFKGGQKEILGSELQHLGWTTQQECLRITTDLMKQPKKLKNLQLQVRKRAEGFGEHAFRLRVLALFQVG